jgi:phosphohistidine phosphatase
VEIWTSPLVRAVQTAEIVAGELELTDGVSVRPELSPAHDPRDVVQALAAAKPGGPLALVGHEPGLSMLASALLGDTAFPGLKKSAVLGVGWKGHGTATFRFLLLPKEMTVVTDLESLG